MSTTNIEWVRNPDGTKGESWPVVTGCSPISTGCRECYAARMAATRLKHHPRYKGLAVMQAPGMPRWTGEVRLNHDVLEQPLRWKKPRMIFVASMGDLFHERVSDPFIWQVFNVMRRADWHTFQILTKRSKRMLQWFNYIGPTVKQLLEWPLPNVWLGVSAENQATANERIPILLQCPAAVRFVSCEPLLASIDLHGIHLGELRFHDVLRGEILEPLDRPGKAVPMYGAPQSAKKLNWVIVGGESGPGARPMMLDWAQNIVDQCQAANVPVFVKQVGAWAAKMGKYKDSKGADPNEWPIDLQIREMPYQPNEEKNESMS